jgi:hypothetical protein
LTEDQGGEAGPVRSLYSFPAVLHLTLLILIRLLSISRSRNSSPSCAG